MIKWRVPAWLVVVGAALLAAVLTLTADRVLLAPRQAPASPTPSATPLPSITAATPRPRVDVVVETTAPTPPPSPLASDQRDRVIRDLQQAADAQRSMNLILTAERHMGLATEALQQNNTKPADDELVAAQAALTEAFRFTPENLKPQLTYELFQIGRMRADLEVDPRDLDQKLQAMRDRLLALVTSTTN